jgi:hypothetical protein
MFHGKTDQCETIYFGGNGIRLLDLKREIIERKNISGSLDFDLKIVDESGRVYENDDEYVPKNSSVVVRRMPAKNAATSLISRLKSSKPGQPQPTKSGSEILMPMKVEAAPEMVEAPAPVPAPVDVKEEKTAEETKPTVPMELSSAELVDEREMNALQLIQSDR